jgi:hypothetical protein
MNELTESPMFGTGALILMFSVNITISVLVGVTFAYLCRLLCRNSPGIGIVLKLLPWRSMTALVMFLFTPSVITSLSFLSGIWNQFINQIVPYSDTYMERLSVISILYQLSFLATAWTAALLVRLWVESSFLSKILSALRSFAVVSIFIMISVQMVTGNDTGLGGTLYDSAMAYDTDAALAAWMQIVWLLIAVDLLLGVIQFVANWLVGRGKESPKFND